MCVPIGQTRKLWLRGKHLAAGARTGKWNEVWADPRGALNWGAGEGGPPPQTLSSPCAPTQPTLHVVFSGLPTGPIRDRSNHSCPAVHWPGCCWNSGVVFRSPVTLTLATATFVRPAQPRPLELLQPSYTTNHPGIPTDSRSWWVGAKTPRFYQAPRDAAAARPRTTL